MSDPYIGEIKMFCGTFAPVGWLFCDGSLQSISNYPPLFNLVGTTYGGDGQSTFGLPDLRGRLPIHVSGTTPLGAASGTETVTLTTPQLPQHLHSFMGSTNTANINGPGNDVVGTSGGIKAFTTGAAAPSPFSNTVIGQSGGNQSHSNLQPFQCVNFIICTDGIYPSQN